MLLQQESSFLSVISPAGLDSSRVITERKTGKIPVKPCGLKKKTPQAAIITHILSCLAGGLKKEKMCVKMMAMPVVFFFLTASSVLFS